MDNRTVIEEIYKTANSGDISVFEALLAEDCVLHEPPHHPAVLADGGHPAPGVWEGRDQTLVGVGKVFAALRLTGVDVKEIVADGPHRVIGLVDVHGTDHEGQPYVMPLVEVFLVSGGKVTEIRAFYWDTAGLCEHAGLPEA